jgi:heat shock protein HtpX
MWEAIASNRRRSALLIGVMGMVLVGLGYLIGAALDPMGGVLGGFERALVPPGGAPSRTVFSDGGLIGAFAALVLWLVLIAVAYAGGDHVLLASARARQIAKEDAPQLWNVVEEMTIAAGLGSLPAVYIIDDDSPNAFAVGRKQEKAAVAVTSGLLSRLNRDELQGVVAHEIAHIKNRDVLFMTFAAVMVGAIVILSDFFLRYMWYGGGRRSSSKRGGQGQAVVLLVALLVALLAPLFARLLYFACSRRREYLADASGARFTRYPEGLASALEKIAGRRQHPQQVNRALAPLYIVNPLQAHGAAGLFSTHPPTEKRVQILRAMAGGASYLDYEAAYKKVEGGAERLIGVKTLAQAERRVPLREPSAEPESKQQVAERAKDVTNLIDRLGGYLALACACGVGIKVPPDFRREAVPCPRCGRINQVPAARPAAEGRSAPLSREASLPEPPLVYRRRVQKGWESFKCACGRAIQLSPSLQASRLRCSRCRREIDILPAEAETNPAAERQA